MLVGERRLSRPRPRESTGLAASLAKALYLCPLLLQNGGTRPRTPSQRGGRGALAGGRGTFPACPGLVGPRLCSTDVVWVSALSPTRRVALGVRGGSHFSQGGGDDPERSEPRRGRGLPEEPPGWPDFHCLIRQKWPCLEGSNTPSGASRPAGWRSGGGGGLDSPLEKLRAEWLGPEDWGFGSPRQPAPSVHPLLWAWRRPCEALAAAPEVWREGHGGLQALVTHPTTRMPEDLHSPSSLDVKGASRVISWVSQPCTPAPNSPLWPSFLV